MIDREALKKQQEVLKTLGYYRGEIDGIWSRKSIEAKLAYERSGKFNPGIPNRGMPFDLRVKLPATLFIDSTGYLAVKVAAQPAAAQPTVTTAPPPVTPPTPPVAAKEVTKEPPKVFNKTDITVDVKDL